MNNQLTELLTNYGPIGAIWFDGFRGISLLILIGNLISNINLYISCSLLA